MYLDKMTLKMHMSNLEGEKKQKNHCKMKKNKELFPYFHPTDKN